MKDFAQRVSSSRKKPKKTKTIFRSKNRSKPVFNYKIILSLLAFYASAKINYILFAFPLYVYFLMIKKDNLKFIFISSLLIFTFIFCPIFLIKYIYFGNPIAPFFDGIFSTNRFLFDSYALSLRS